MEPRAASSEPPSLSASSSLKRKGVTRSDSLRIRLPKSAPTNTPIPPSLLQSPHLLADSIFQKGNPRTSSVSSKEDDPWLLDTVPLSPDREKSKSTPNSAPSQPDLRVKTLSPLSIPLSCARVDTKSLRSKDTTRCLAGPFRGNHNTPDN